MVYISNPTEDGTLYTKEELTDLSATCYDCGLYLFVDGARMAYGLASEANDLNLQDYANLCDVFYLGGTKCGALFGEAVIINNPDLDQDFRYAIKQHGAMLAKGRLLGVQFDALFTDDLYFRISRHAIEMAHQIRDIFVSAGYPLRRTARPSASALRLKQRAAPCCLIPPPTSSSPSCPTAGTMP